MKRYYFIVFFLISYFSFSQSEIRNVFAISTNHFGHNFNLNQKDSVVLLKDSVVLLYDALGNKVEEKYFEVGSFVGFSYRKINRYNQTKLTQSLELKLNGQLNLWDTVFKKEYCYASNDSLEKVIFSKKSNNYWMYTQKIELQFDEQNRITAQVESDWNCLTNKFIEKHKESFKYNKKNQIVQINRQVCNLNGVWLNTGKDSIVYKNGLKVENYSFYFDDSDRGVWLKTSKETISYDSLNNHYQTLIQHWLPEQNKFVTNEYTRLITSHYNQKNQLNFINDKIFNPSLNRFEDYEQKFYY